MDLSLNSVSRQVGRAFGPIQRPFVKERREIMNMNKLATAFAAMACIMVSASVFPKAPVISGVPDIIIGDREDNVLTVDNNWFRYANAINILDYVTDVDSLQSDLLFTFVEETTAKDLGIRIDAPGATGATVSQLDAVDSATVVADWTGHEITNYADPAHRDYLLTFVDLIRSADPYGSVPYSNPVTNGGAPITSATLADLGWHNTEGSGALQDASRTVWIYVADDPLASGPDRVDNDAITVISRNYGFDSLSGGVTTAFESGFANGAGTTGNASSWSSLTVSGMTACTITSGSGTSGGNGYLSLASGTATTNGFTRWQSQNNVAPPGHPELTPYVGAVPYVTPGPGESLIYCARFTMSQNQADRGVAPAIRFGANQVTSSMIDMVTMKPVSGAGNTPYNPQVPAQNLNHTYKSVWAANEGSPDFAKLDWTTLGGVDMRGYNLYFDILDQFSDQGGAWTIWNVDVVTTARPADVAAAVTETDFRSSNGWTTLASGPSSITATWDGTGKMTFNDTGNPHAGTGFPYLMWGKAINRTAVKWDSNQLLRFKTAMSCPAAADRQSFHWFRLRQSLTYYNVGHEWAILGDGARVAPTIGGYPMIPPATPGTPFVYESYLSSQVDDANFDWAPIRAVTGADTYNLYVEGLALPQGSEVGTFPGASPTHYTVQSVAVEALADPF